MNYPRYKYVFLQYLTLSLLYFLCLFEIHNGKYPEQKSNTG